MLVQSFLAGVGAWQPLLPVTDSAQWRGAVAGAAPYSVRIQSSLSQVLVLPNVVTNAVAGDYVSTGQLAGAWGLGCTLRACFAAMLS